MSKKDHKPNLIQKFFKMRFALVYVIFFGLVLVISSLNMMINSHDNQERLFEFIKTKSNIEIKHKDLNIQLFTGLLKGENLKIHLKKNKMKMTLNEFQIQYNPLYLLLGQIKVNSVRAKEILVNTSEFQKNGEVKEQKVPKFLQQIKLKYARVDNFTWIQSEDRILNLDSVSLETKIGSFIQSTPAVMTIKGLKYFHNKVHLFIDEIKQDGFIIFDFSKPRILDESKLSSTVDVKNILLSIRKKKKEWLTNRGWDQSFDQVIKSQYGPIIPDDRSYSAIDSVSFDIDRTKAQTTLHSLLIQMSDSKILGKGRWNTRKQTLDFSLKTPEPVSISKLPLGQLQFRTAFDKLQMSLEVSGMLKDLESHNLNFNLSGQLMGNLVNPKAGDLNVVMSGALENTNIKLKNLTGKIAQGSIEAKGQTSLKTLTTQTQVTLNNFDVLTLMRMISKQNIPSIASGSGQISGKLTSPKITLNFQSSNGTYEFLNFGPTQGKLAIENKNLSLEAKNTSSNFGQNQIKLNIENVFDLFRQKLSLRTVHKNVSIAPLLKTQNIDGRISGEFHLSRINAIASGKGEFEAKNFIFNNKLIGNIKTNLKLKQKHLDVAPITIRYNTPKMSTVSRNGLAFDFTDLGYRLKGNISPELGIEGTYRKENKNNINLNFSARNMSLKPFSALLPFTPVKSKATGNLQLNYNISSPLLSQFKSQWQSFDLETYEGKFHLNSRAQLQYQNQSFFFQNFDVRVGQGRFLLNGPISLEGTSALRVKGKVDFNLLSDFNPFISESDNPIDVDLTLKGNIRKPLFYGKINFRNDALVFRNTPGDFEEMNGTLFLDGQRMRFENFHFIYNDAPIQLKGSLTTDYQIITGAQLSLSGKEVPVHMSNGLNFLADTDIKIQGSGSPLVKGKINIVEGQFNREFGLNNFTLSASNVDDEETSLKILPPTTRLQLEVKNTGDFYMSNAMSEIEMHLDFDLLGTIANPLLSGQVDFISGTINAFGVSFENATGFAQFRKRKDIDPDINLTAKKEFQEYEIFAQIIGKLSNLNLRLRSTPSLDRRDILSLLFYGQTPDQLTGDERARFTQTAAISQLAYLLSKPIYELSGLDVVEVSSRQESSNQTIQRFSLGKTISNRFDIKFTTDLGIEDPEQAFEMQYQIFDNFYFVAAKDIDDRNRYRFDINYRFELH